MLQSKVVSWDLEDGEIIDIDGDEGDNSNDEMSDAGDLAEDEHGTGPVFCRKPAPQVRTKCVEALPSQDSTCQPSSKGTDILEKISKTFDPEIQSCREADCASSMFQSHQLILLQSQIRDLNNTILSLRSQLDDAEHRRVDADHHTDRLQNQIDITLAVTHACLYRSTVCVPRHVSPISISSSPEPTPNHTH